MDINKNMTLRVPKEIYEKIVRESKKQNRSIHNQILTILIKYFDEKDTSK